MKQNAHHTGRNRILSVDSMRGVAMSLVVFAHCLPFLNQSSVPPFAYELLSRFVKIASVAFMSISGVMIAYFYFTRPDQWKVYRRFARRAAFLLLLAHPTIELAKWGFTDHTAGFFYTTAHHFLITDTIAVSLLLAPFLIRSFSHQARALVIIVFLSVTPFAVAFFHPDAAWLTGIKEALFGQLPGSTSPIRVDRPLLPWMAMFLSGSLMGGLLASLKQKKLSIETLARRMKQVAIGLTLLGVVLTGGYKLFAVMFEGQVSADFLDAIYPSRTTTLLPIYLAVLIWVFAFLIRHIDGRGRYDLPTWIFSVLGRTSLFVFVMQFAVIQSIPAMLGLKGKLNPWQTGLFFIVGYATCWLLSYTYGRLRGWIAPDDYKQLSRPGQPPPSADTNKATTTRTIAPE